MRPSSPLNVDVKIISKAPSKRLKNVFLSLFQIINPYMLMGNSLVKGGRLIADALQTTDVLKLNGMLVTINIQKAFDSVNHQFLM